MIQWSDFKAWPWVPKLLLVLGCIGPLGFVSNFKPLKGLALAWMISPLPIVFSDSNGFEAFAARFKIRLTLTDKSTVLAPITFKEGSRLQGPYNRRNVYGAVIGYAPRLPINMVHSVLNYGFCQSQILTEEFQMPKNIERVELLIEDGTTGRDQKFNYDVACGQ